MYSQFDRRFDDWSFSNGRSTSDNLSNGLMYSQFNKWIDSKYFNSSGNGVFLSFFNRIISSSALSGEFYQVQPLLFQRLHQL